MKHRQSTNKAAEDENDFSEMRRRPSMTAVADIFRNPLAKIGSIWALGIPICLCNYVRTGSIGELNGAVLTAALWVAMIVAGNRRPEVEGLFPGLDDLTERVLWIAFLISIFGSGIIAAGLDDLLDATLVISYRHIIALALYDTLPFLLLYTIRTRRQLQGDNLPDFPE